MYQNDEDPWIVPARSIFFPKRTKKPIPNPRFFRNLIQEVTDCVGEVRSKEFDFILAIQKIAHYQGHKYMGFRSIKSFCAGTYKMSEAEAETYVEVALKASKCDRLQEVLRNGELSLVTAKKILKVLTVENQNHWVELAMTLPTRQLEREIKMDKSRQPSF